MSLVHVVARVGGSLLVGLCGDIGGAVEGLEAGEEGASADVDGGGVASELCGVDEGAEGVDDGVGDGRTVLDVAGGHGGE